MNCKNCQFQFEDHLDYCSKCGAKVVRNRLTFKNLFAHFSETFLNYDNKLLQTFIALFKQPEIVIDGYINGLRKRFVNPISYFAISLTLAGLYLYITVKYFPEALDVSSITADGQEEMSQNFLNFFMENQALMTFANIPVYAFLGWLTFKTLKRYNYVSHVVVSLYLIPQMSFALYIPQLVLMFFGFTMGDFSLYLLVLQMLYFGYVYYHIFKLSRQGLVLRTLLFLAILFVFFVIASVVMAIYLINTGKIQEFIEAEKARQEAGAFLSHFFFQELNLV